LRRLLQTLGRELERCLFISLLRTLERTSLRRLERELLQTEEQLLLRYVGRVQVRAKLMGLEDVRLQMDERTPARGLVFGPEQGKKQTPDLGPKQRLLQLEEREPHRGLHLPQWSRGQDLRADEVRSQRSEAGSQKYGTDGRRMT